MQASEFSNNVIPVSELPSLTTVTSEPISPAYRRLNLWLTSGIFGGVAAILVLVLIQPWFALLPPAPFIVSLCIGGVLFIGSWLFLYHFFADPLIRYSIREQDLVLFKGLLFKDVICQPILRIQHIDIQRGPFERMAGLATLKVYSAGGSLHTLAIPGLPADTADTIRQFVLNHSDLTQDEA